MEVPDDRVVVRLLNDGPMKWPLWFGNAVADDRSRQPISSDLAHALLEWTNFYHEHYDDEWDSTENAARYNATGVRLATRTKTELGPQFRVLLRLEQTESEEQRWTEIPGV